MGMNLSKLWETVKGSTPGFPALHSLPEFAQLNGYESEQTLGDCEGQETLVCCSPWGCNKSDMTERLNSNNI